MNKKIIGQRIKERRQELNLSQGDIAKAIGVATSTIQRYEVGAIERVKLPVLEAIARAINVSPEWLAGKSDKKELGWEEEKSESVLDVFRVPNISPIPKTKTVPLLGNIACGEPITAVENIERYVNISEDISCEFALTCKGDSMTGARILDGDIVFIHEQPMVENGEIAAVLIGGEATLKRVYYYPDKNKLVLNAENPQFEPLVYIGEELNDIRIIGKAVAFQSAVI